jgi:hypothetical protein
MDLPTILSSGVVAGLVAGLVALRTSERKIAIENITQLRTLWRDKVRENALEVTSAYRYKNSTKLIDLYVTFQLILNPEDDDDLSILDTLWEMQANESDSNLSIVFSEKLSQLLKHDWERAKIEAKPIWYF